MIFAAAAPLMDTPCSISTRYVSLSRTPVALSNPGTTASFPLDTVTFGFEPLGGRVKVGAGRNGVVNRCVGVGTITGVGDVVGTSVVGLATACPATTS
jgi:hypothetical protein